MRLFQKAKKLGTWDPQALDFSSDAADWTGFDDTEHDFLLRTLALLPAGEEGVTSDLLPLIMAGADEGPLEDESDLTPCLCAEPKHVEFVRRRREERAIAHGDH